MLHQEKSDISYAVNAFKKTPYVKLFNEKVFVFLT